jgi:hypothetical protein
MEERMLDDMAYSMDRHCKGCIHCGLIGAMYGCNYIFNTGHKRPCDPGEGCTAKETRKRGRKKKVAV